MPERLQIERLGGPVWIKVNCNTAHVSKARPQTILVSTNSKITLPHPCAFQGRIAVISSPAFRDQPRRGHDPKYSRLGQQRTP